MKIGILSRNKQLHSIRRLLSEAKRRGVQCDIINPLECQLVIEGKHLKIDVGNQPLPHYDVVLPRIGASITDYGLAVVRQFECLGTYAVNGSRAIAESRDKMRCLQLLAGAGLRVPPTVLAKSTRSFKTAIAAVGGMPVVLKVLQGTQGVGVMIVNSQASLVSVMDTLQGLEQDTMMQQFLSEGAGRDYRAFVIGNRVIAAMMRTAPKGEFRTNIHRGGEGSLVKLPMSYQRAAIRAAQKLKLEIAGVDLMESSAGPVIIEVNSSPGFEGIEKATGLNVAALIVNHLITTGKKIIRRRKKTKKR